VAVGVAGLVFTAIGSAAGVIGAYFTWLAVRPRLARRKPTRGRSSALEMVPDKAGHAVYVYDVFVSYSHSDLDWVTEFAARLESAGLRVARDEVFLRPGDVLVHAIEQAIRDSAHGVLVFSRASVASGWVQQEYAALMQRSIEGGQRFIPVVIDDVELPGFAATRYYADFRHVSAEDSDRLTSKIIEALRGTTGRALGA
jgi:TIR domain-containing protein